MRLHPNTSLAMQQKLTRAQLIVLATLFGVSAIAVGWQMPHATAQNKLAVEPTGPERKLKYEVPAHIPLKLEVRNVEKEHWMREMEVEVTNTGDKPIYFLEFIVELPEVISPLGNITGYTLTYGSFEIMDFSTRPRVEDEPIQPGKSYTFKFPAKWVADWEWGKEKEGLADPQQLLLVFHRLNYGDGTGFLGRHGTPLPLKQTRKISCGKQDRPAVGSLASVAQASRAPDVIVQPLFRSLPADMLPVTSEKLTSQLTIRTVRASVRKATGARMQIWKQE